ncbi:alpha/beta fold hydrolase [Streptomyces yangpuensis]|uniref:alpha/beta fold hydrolase n=1 Tax=Streptomyces yangpuensis TaxID=1648182 RepID=UPI003716296A
MTGRPLAYRVAGPPDGDPLVLLPASADWAPLRDVLARTRRVYTPDLGGSAGRPGVVPPPERMCGELLDFVDALGLDRVDLVGHAEGAVAARLVARTRPGLVARLVLEGDGFSPGSDDPDSSGRITAPTLVLADGTTSAPGQDRTAEPARRIPGARPAAVPAAGPVDADAPGAFVRAVVDFLDEPADSGTARLWLAERGVVRTGEDSWTDGESEEGRLTSNEVAHAWAAAALGDESLDPEQRLRLGFGLVDLLDAYWVTVEIAFAVRRSTDPEVTRALWNGYRSRLGAPSEAEAITYSLWVDWFEDRATAETAFHEVLGKDVGQLLPDAPESVLRRASRVLESSGPVPWGTKEPVYRAASRVPALHEAVFRGILHSHHDVYGDLDPAPALAVLALLDLPQDTRHLAELRSALAGGPRR